MRVGLRPPDRRTPRGRAGRNASTLGTTFRARRLAPAGLARRSLGPAPLLRRSRDAGPFVHLHADNERVTSVLRAEDRSLALLHVEPVLAERVDDVRLVRDEDGIGAGIGGRRKQLAKRLGAAVVLIRRHDEAALREVRRLLDVLEAGKDSGLVGPIVLAGIDLADRDPEPTQGLAELPRQRVALVVEIALSRDVLEIERVGVGLVGKRG